MLIPDGLWMDLPHEAHVADPALGSTDLKGLLLNPVFWHGSQRNPVWMRVLADLQTRTTALRAASGRAYGECLHTMLLLPHTFDDRYFVRPEMPDLPETKDEIAAELRARGLTPPVKSRPRLDFEAMARMYHITLADDWDGQVRMMANGRTIIPQGWRSSLEVTKRVFDRHSEAGKFIANGRPEVSMFWTDEHGDRYKARFDYLRVRTLADLKSYENRNGGDAIAVFSAARDKFAYDMQAAYYLDARMTVLPDMVAKRRIWRGPPVEVDGGIEALPATADDLDFFDKVADYRDPSWWWLAVSTMGVPEVDTIEYPRELIAFSSAKVQVDQARQTYRDYRAKFGADDNEMWVSDRGLIRFSEHSFGRRALDRGAPLHDTVGG